MFLKKHMFPALANQFQIILVQRRASDQNASELYEIVYNYNFVDLLSCIFTHFNISQHIVAFPMTNSFT